jgi:hypothetical protein
MSNSPNSIFFFFMPWARATGVSCLLLPRPKEQMPRRVGAMFVPAAAGGVASFDVFLKTLLPTNALLAERTSVLRNTTNFLARLADEKFETFSMVLFGTTSAEFYFGPGVLSAGQYAPTLSGGNPWPFGRCAECTHKRSAGVVWRSGVLGTGC